MPHPPPCPGFDTSTEVRSLGCASGMGVSPAMPVPDVCSVVPRSAGPAPVAECLTRSDSPRAAPLHRLDNESRNASVRLRSPAVRLTYGFLGSLGDRLTAGRQILALAIKVRILVPQLHPPPQRRHAEDRSLSSWPHRLAVRTPASHVGNTGSIPVGVTTAQVRLGQANGHLSLLYCAPIRPALRTAKGEFPLGARGERIAGRWEGLPPDPQDLPVFVPSLCCDRSSRARPTRPSSSPWLGALAFLEKEGRSGQA